MSVQPRWSHIPAYLLFTPFLPRGHCSNKYWKTSISSSNGQSFTVAAHTNVSRFPDELGVGDSFSSTTTGASTHSAACQSSSGNATVDVGKNDSIREGVSNNSKGENTGSSRSQSSSQHRLASGQQSQSSGYSYQRCGSVSQRNTSGNEWSYRRIGYHSRNQSFNSEKGFPSAKVKQIYVAKQTSSGT